MLRGKLGWIGRLVEVATVDSYQGRENDVIIISAVRSNANNSVGFLNDRGRINVAMTRAKKLCVLVCDSSTLEGTTEGEGFLERLVTYFRENGVVWDNKIGLKVKGYANQYFKVPTS